MSSENYIYLLKPFLSIEKNENVYKIGKTHRNNLKRFSEYPIGSKLIFQLACLNCDTMEKKLLDVYKSIFIFRKDYGLEYFEGDSKEMIKIIFEEITNEKIDEKTDEMTDESTDEKMDEKTDEKIDEKTDEKINEMFVCSSCNYNTSKKSDYDKHIMTAKHKLFTSSNDFISKYHCDICDKKYNSRVGLWYHKKKCLNKKNIIGSNKDSHDYNKESIINIIKENQEMKMLLIEQNQEMKGLIIEQNKQIQEQSKKNNEVINKFISTVNNIDL
jgi:hypothetical protein